MQKIDRTRLMDLLKEAGVEVIQLDKTKKIKALEN